MLFLIHNKKEKGKGSNGSIAFNDTYEKMHICYLQGLGHPAFPGVVGASFFSAYDCLRLVINSY